MRPDLELELEYYKQCLKDNNVNKIAIDYLNSRNIEQRTVDFWEIGYCPIGCVPPNFNKDDTYKPFEKMYGRIIFPIRNSNGELISLSGRLIVPDGRPKYDHYSFPSRKILFGLYQNKNNIRNKNKCIITEGQIDVITSWQKGLDIVTSSFGAHCSLEHFAILSRYTNNVDILYDNDNAGKEGTKNIKSFSTHGNLNINYKTNIFPKGEDLDSYLSKNDLNKLYDLLDDNKLLKNKLNLIKRQLRS